MVERRMNEITLNKHGTNTSIKAHLLPDKQMRDIGFTDYIVGRWYFCRCFKPNKKRDYEYEITLNITINKIDPNDLQIDILDEEYCQPYDYQYILERNPESEVALKVQTFVEEWMEYLQNKGVLSGHLRGEYI